MVKLTSPVPVHRVFDETKTKAFYVDFLGFEVDFEHRCAENYPLYLGVSRTGCKLHLSEHNGDCSPVIIFFIAFVPQFVAVDSPLLPQFAILVFTFVGLEAINALAYALLADKLRTKIAKPSVLAWSSRLGGSALIAMGVAIAAFKRAQ